MLRPLSFALMSAFVLAACGSDPADACAEAYAHLSAIAKRRPDRDKTVEFIAACVAVDDAPRVACLRTATTPGEALACKPVKKRPG